MLVEELDALELDRVEDDSELELLVLETEEELLIGVEDDRELDPVDFDT